MRLGFLANVKISVASGKNENVLEFQEGTFCSLATFLFSLKNRI